MHITYTIIRTAMLLTMNIQFSFQSWLSVSLWMVYLYTSSWRFFRWLQICSILPRYLKSTNLSTFSHCHYTFTFVLITQIFKVFPNITYSFPKFVWVFI